MRILLLSTSLPLEGALTINYVYSLGYIHININPQTLCLIDDDNPIIFDFDSCWLAGKILKFKLLNDWDVIIEIWVWLSGFTEDYVDNWAIPDTVNPKSLSKFQSH